MNMADSIRSVWMNSPLEEFEPPAPRQNPLAGDSGFFIFKNHALFHPPSGPATGIFNGPQPKSKFVAVMKKLLRMVATTATLVFLVTPLHAQVPNLVSYQGRVAVGATNFDGPGQFKFAFVNYPVTISFPWDGMSRVQFKWAAMGDDESLAVLPVMKTDVSLWSQNRSILLDCKFYAQNSVFDLKSATGSSKLKCYHARTDPIGRWGQSSHFNICLGIALPPTADRLGIRLARSVVESEVEC